MSDIQYQFAACSNGSIIDIDTMNSRNRRDFGKFSCLGCEQEMIASLGTKVRHHFKHKSDNEADCSPETYLHSLAKTIVYDALTHRLQVGEPCLIQLEQGKVDIVKDAKNRSISETYSSDKRNILLGATEILLEKKVGDFIPDICILRADNPPVYFEIAVTHSCDLEKINAGIPIVEIRINKEGDLRKLREAFEQGLICEGEFDITFHNVKIRESISIVDIDHHNEEEDEYRRFGRLLPNGCVIINNESSRKNRKYETVIYVPENSRPLAVIDAFCQYLRFDRSRRVSSCLLCVRHGFASAPAGKPMFCKKYLTTCKHTDATGCKSYYPYKTLEALQKHREKLASNPKASARARSMLPNLESFEFDDP